MSLRPEPSWWARARVLRSYGLTQDGIAESLGFSRGGVLRALYPERYRPFSEREKQERAFARATRPLSPAQEAARLVREEGRRPVEAALATGAKLGTVYTALFRIREREQAQERRA